MSLFDEILEDQQEYHRKTQSMMGIVYGVVKENWDQEKALTYRVSASIFRL